MKLRSTVPCMIIALAVATAIIPTVAAASYTLSISPSTPVSLGTIITLSLSLTGGSRNTAYTILFQVVKPGGNGSATLSTNLQTNNQGAGSTQPTTYPNPSWTSTSGTVATDVDGVYNDLILYSLSTYNSKGSPTTNFSPGDTIYASFKIRYSSSSSSSELTSGQYYVSLRNPSGALVANMTASYDPLLSAFYTSTGYPISNFESGGNWNVVISANSLDDGNGNTGPVLSVSVPVQIVTSPLTYWPFVVAGIVAVLGGIVTVKRFDTSLEGFQHLEQMMGGPLPRGASILLLGDAGSGKTILSYQLLHDELESGRLCALLSYDAFPEDVQARMTEFGWDIISHLRKGRLKIIDCYSGLAGQGEGAIKDPSDLTELNIQITAFIAKAKGSPVTVVLDSLTPIFNGVDEKQAVNFIQTLGAKVKKTGGLFIETASKGAIPDDAVAKLRTMADGVFELGIVRSRGKSHRFLTVPKMERRRISSDSVPFQIDRNRGFVFRVSRFRLLKKRFFDFLAQHHLLRSAESGENKPKPPPIKGPPARPR